jgi:hypothetical protein
MARRADVRESPGMNTEPLPSTLAPFDWNAAPSGSSGYWELGWELLAQMKVRFAKDGIFPRDRSEIGTIWTPAVDLALNPPSTLTWFTEGEYVPARSAVSIADAGSPGRLLRGTPLRLESVQDDRYWEGLGTNFWSVDDPDLDVGFIHSALEGRWGVTSVLADCLIVPIDHPIVGEDERADRLVRDLQAITVAFRDAHGLSPREPGVPRSAVERLSNTDA